MQISSSANEKEQVLLELLKPCKSNIKKAFFRLASHLICKAEESAPSILQKLLHYCKSIIITSHLVSFTFLLDTPIEAWKNYSSLWKIINFARIDPVCAELNSLPVCLNFVFGLTFTIFFLMIIIFLRNLTKNRRMERTGLLLNKLLKLFDLLKIPMLTILLLSLKYSWQKKKTTEYTKTEYLNYSIERLVLGFISIVIIFAILYIQQVFAYRCWHFESFHSTTNKTHSKIDQLSYATLNFSVISFVFLRDSFIIYRVSTILINLPLVYMYYRYLPYFNEEMNFMVSSTHLIVVISNFIMLFGYLANNSIFCILGFVLVIPSGLVIWYSAFLFRKDILKSLPYQHFGQIWDFELILREKFKSEELVDKQKIVEEFSKFNENNRESRNRVFILWKASFCITFHETNKFAILDINQKTRKKATLEEDFQFYVLNKQIKQLCIVYPEYYLIKKYLKSQTAKNEDKKTCYSLLNFFELIMGKNLNLHKLEESIKVMVESTYKCNENYKKTSLKFPDSIETLHLHSTFLSTYLGNHKKSKELISKKEFLIKLQGKETESSFIFKDQNPFIIVSAESLNLGKVLYANQNYKTWKQDIEINIVSKDLTELFPASFEFLSNKHLKEFILEPSNDLIYIDCVLPVINFEKNLEETRVFIVLMGYGIRFFLVIFNKQRYHREIILVNKEGLIEGWSSDIKNLLKIEGIEIGMNLKEIFPMSLWELKENQNLEVNINGRLIISRYHKEVVHGFKIRLIGLYFDGEAYKNQGFSDNYMINIEKEEEEEDDEKMVKFGSIMQSSINKNCQSKLGYTTVNEDNTTKLKFENESSSSSKHILAKRALLYSAQCIKSLKILKVIFSTFVKAN